MIGAAASYALSRFEYWPKLGLIGLFAACVPLAVWFLRDYFQTIPIDLEESAFIDGANRYQVLWRIILPLAMPGLIATCLIVLVFAWQRVHNGPVPDGALKHKPCRCWWLHKMPHAGHSGGIFPYWSC